MPRRGAALRAAAPLLLLLLVVCRVVPAGGADRNVLQRLWAKAPRGRRDSLKLLKYSHGKCHKPRENDAREPRKNFE
jgi:hypothetical protein